jgi:hypothetical protein
VHHSSLAQVRFGSKADIGLPPVDVRFTTESGHQLSPLWYRRAVNLGAVLRDELQNHGHVSPTSRLSAIYGTSEGYLLRRRWCRQFVDPTLLKRTAVQRTVQLTSKSPSF